MIRPEQIPDEVLETLMERMRWPSAIVYPDGRALFKSHIAAAINAWSGACEIEDHDQIPYLALPLPQKKQDG